MLLSKSVSSELICSLPPGGYSVGFWELTGKEAYVMNVVGTKGSYSLSQSLCFQGNVLPHLQSRFVFPKLKLV